MIDFREWSKLIACNGITLKTYKYSNGSWLGWVDAGSFCLGFVDTEWNLHLYTNRIH